ncbi:choline O-acetyltransferase [Drosophila guanche]|uniref:choline O-acetyltransferase n=1 Tax=Drosophila guanche TaxID=7266 RepID=UPI0014712230|nr:choline O-acetyltransferase [Drosophila guanche]
MCMGTGVLVRLSARPCGAPPKPANWLTAPWRRMRRILRRGKLTRGKRAQTGLRAATPQTFQAEYRQNNGFEKDPSAKGANVASNEGNSSAAGSGAESAALFSKLRSFSIGSGPNSPQRVVSNLRGFLTHRLSNITPSDTGWKDSILSIPKKWLSTAESVDEFGFPDTLPKIPVPPLEETMADYVRALEPITTPAQLERTKELIRQFTAPQALGERLHQYLLDKREVEDNWAYYYWLNDMYMNVRIPLPINSNPGMVFPPRRFKTVHDVAHFAARLLAGILAHKEMLDSGELPLERAASREKNQPLCMAQYYRLLGSCRRPGVERDSQYLPSRERTNDEDRHVVVICRNQMYCVVLQASDRGKLSESEIASQILYVLSDAPCLPAKPLPVGLLTAEPRTRWARDREALQSDERNQRNLELIETAQVVLCLDEPLGGNFNARGFSGATPSMHRAGDRDETNMAHEMIHGGGSEYNSGNRWFDKTMQLIICTDGTWGLCYEHSTSEGIAVVQLLEKIYKNIVDHPDEDNGLPQHHLPPPERLEWHVSGPQLQLRFGQAAKSVDKAIDDLDFYVYRYRGYGKTFIKSCQVSPDVYIQLALQLAHFKLYGRLVATYESASTRRFLHGRVDCIRAASTEALEWAKAMCQGEGANVTLESDREDEEEARKVTFSIYSKDHLRELFRCAVARQTEVMVKNILGSGIDIPLLGLREASVEVTGEMAELFTDESYKISQCFLLSTSQVACSTDSFMGYGPVTPRGYGCSYNPQPEQIVFCVSAFYSCEDTSASRYAKSLQDSLDIMRDLLQN